MSVGLGVDVAILSNTARESRFLIRASAEGINRRRTTTGSIVMRGTAWADIEMNTSNYSRFMRELVCMWNKELKSQ